MEDSLNPKISNLRQWLALARMPGLGSRGIQRLLHQFGTPARLFECAAGGRHETGLKPEILAYLRSPDWAAVRQDMDWLRQPGHHLLTLDHPLYPRLLGETADPPPLLFVNGDPLLLSSPQLAIVGSRNPSASGRRTALDFAHCLAQSGITVTSGLAVGIDGASHQGALDGGGRTLAVTGTGPDRLYPSRHMELARRIAGHGALVTEFPPGTPPRRGHFPRRNRIIAGLSLGTLVVEAALHSGSLITARLAADQGREVFAIPGSIHNPLARGCHWLIRQGAKLVETAQDVLEELAPLLGELRVPAPEELPAENRNGPAWDADYRKLLGNLGFDPLPIDLLIRRSGLTADAVSSMLLVLELEGFVSSSPGGRYCLTGKSIQATPG